jgi:hypothetical protein
MKRRINYFFSAHLKTHWSSRAAAPAFSELPRPTVQLPAIKLCLPGSSLANALRRSINRRPHRYEVALPCEVVPANEARLLHANMLHEHRESRHPSSMQVARAHQEAARQRVIVVHARIHSHVQHLLGSRGKGGACAGGAGGSRAQRQWGGGWTSCRLVLSMAG